MLKMYSVSLCSCLYPLQIQFYVALYAFCGSVKINDNNDNNNNNNDIERRSSRFFAVSSLCSELSPAHTLTGQGAFVCKLFVTHWALITFNISCATWYGETAQLLSLTELKLHLYLIICSWLKPDEEREETGVPRENP